MNTRIVEEKLSVLKKQKSIIRFAYGNEKLKTWFITKSNRQILPNGSRLIFILTCELTSDEISISETYPTKDQIIGDINGQHLKIINVEYL